MATSRKPSTTTRRWPCVFTDPFVRDELDPRIAEAWKVVTGSNAPFGDLRNMWRRHHCRTLNPYGSESCPYPNRDCALAFYSAVTTTLDARPRVPVGYFNRVAKTSAAIRADNKPLARDIMRTHEAQPDPSQGPSGPRQSGVAPVRSRPRSWVRGPEDRPASLGDVLRALDPRSRQGPTDDGQEGSQ